MYAVCVAFFPPSSNGFLVGNLSLAGIFFLDYLFSKRCKSYGANRVFWREKHCILLNGEFSPTEQKIN
jgi:hypothetical protein